jgi:hypothetical protein
MLGHGRAIGDPRLPRQGADRQQPDEVKQVSSAATPACRCRYRIRRRSGATLLDLFAQ